MNPNIEHGEQDATRAVVVRLSALGDVLLTTGVLRHWHATRGMTCTVLTRAAFAPVFAGHPAVTETIALNDAELAGARLFCRWRELAARFSGQTLIDLHGTGRTRLLGLVWRGPVRRYAKEGLARRGFLLSRGRLGGARLRAARVVERYALTLDAALPPLAALTPQVWLTPAERACGEACAAAVTGARGVRPVALHPFAAHAGKMWPVGHWRALMRLLDAQGIPWCVIGRGEMAGIPSGRDLTNRHTIRESAAVLAACSVLVTGDSGPMHLAAAVGTPVAALFGSTTREWGFFPFGPQDVVLEKPLACRPCNLHGAGTCTREYACLTGITPHEVLMAVRRIGEAQ